MAQAPERKLFLGPRLRRLRRDLGLTQTRMAEDLGVSPSYLNLWSATSGRSPPRCCCGWPRPTTSTSAASRRTTRRPARATCTEVFADPLFRDLAVARHEVAEVAENAPGVADAIVRLYRAFADRRRLAEFGALPRAEEGAEGLAFTPSDWVRDYIQGAAQLLPRAGRGRRGAGAAS